MSIKNKTIILGSNGYIGTYLLERFKELDTKNIGLARNTTPYFELVKSSSWVFDASIKYAIICAAKVNIAQCERSSEETSFINVKQTLKLAAHLISLGITPIIFSSDYVFDGNGSNYSEDSLTNPVNEYGKQKELLEKALLDKFTDKCIILRLSKVYGNEPYHRTFISEMIELFKNEKNINAAVDQIFCPVHLEDIFKTINYLQQEKLTGLFNLCGSKAYQRFELAEMVANEFGFNKNKIKKISLKELGENFKRPFNTSMVSKRLDLEKISSIEDNIRKIHKRYERKKSMA